MELTRGDHVGTSTMLWSCRCRLRRWDAAEGTSGVCAEEKQEPRTLKILDVQIPFLQHAVHLLSSPGAEPP